MPASRIHSISGHVYPVSRKREGELFYCKYRQPDGRQRKKKLGKVWTKRGRPPRGYLTEQQAQKRLDAILDDLRGGVHPGMVQTGVTFAVAVEDFLRWLKVERGRKSSTIRGYRWVVQSLMYPTFKDRLIETITTADIEAWLSGLHQSQATRRKAYIVMAGVFRRAKKVYELPFDPCLDVEKPPPPKRRKSINVFSPDDVWALTRAARDPQDAALYLTAALTGLRMGELIALRWRDVDLAAMTVRVCMNYVGGELTTPKSGDPRPVPMAPQVARALTELRELRGEDWTGRDDLVFVGRFGGYLDSKKLRNRFKAARDRVGLPPYRFHDLRHTFGTVVVAHGADIHKIMQWYGHQDISTTMIYLHYSPRDEDAALVARAFGGGDEPAQEQTTPAAASEDGPVVDWDAIDIEQDPGATAPELIAA